MCGDIQEVTGVQKFTELWHCHCLQQSLVVQQQAKQEFFVQNEIPEQEIGRPGIRTDRKCLSCPRPGCCFMLEADWALVSRLTRRCLADNVCEAVCSKSCVAASSCSGSPAWGQGATLNPNREGFLGPYMLQRSDLYNQGWHWLGHRWANQAARDVFSNQPLQQ